MQRRSKLFRSEQHVDVTSVGPTCDKTSTCDEEYDPFAEEYGYEEEVPSWSTPALPSSNFQSLNVNSTNASASNASTQPDAITTNTNSAENSEYISSLVTDASVCAPATQEPLIVVVNDTSSCGSASFKVSPMTPEQKVGILDQYSLYNWHLRICGRVVIR